MNRIKNLREKEEISQDQLAKILGVNLRTLQRWESGETSIRTKNATQLADYFGVSVGYLLGYEMNLKEAHEKLKEFNSTLPTVKEFDEVLFEKQEKRFKRFVQFVSDEEMKIKDRNLVLIFNLLVSSDETFGVNQIYPFLLDEKDEYHFTNQEKSE
ncbi:helix-turn-helix domain-containing protein [Streptococcus pseudopneumoniae]|uniref:helix-turn-helix domain-containing protein n=1 Tax=Streptococcus pseudopneumoniae TaxID=257758 RepID=UPI00110C2358|nr:helix-turn-helix transcriptional regulator [Streptococcus pseudopneumoniae]MBF9670802.1 helix-turn-helix transcriptional regulator [Streptococcus pseudopneumoniae]MBF9680787.1 helix-turn-helix transcriptional regulator [Streptococcus pseudopneumoniae]MBW8145278.1 helix-turn-helix transcriptional regulator [Streptococcus pseudopneumoniae]TMR85660.1 XRE family transcriptional regulator [Streptococcus pseudopneumoniae]